MTTAIITAVLFLVIMGVLFAVLLVIAEKKLLNYGPCDISINGGERKLTIKGGGSLLTGLLENEIYIPSACGGRGSCAYCKVKVHEGGGPLSPVEEPYLSPEERKNNVRLSCQVKIRGPLSIEIPKELFSIRRHKARLVHKKQLTHDIVELRMEFISPSSMSFKAGQYVQLESKEYAKQDRVIRAYSVSSMPSDSRFIELVVRRVPNGICTTWVFDHLKEGEEIFVAGPYGEFALSDTGAPAIFIAGGSGMAPFWGMLRHMREVNDTRKVTYFFGATAQRDLFYSDGLAALEKELSSFRYVPCLSAEPAESNWTGERGLVTAVAAKTIPDMTGYEAYLCGSPGMIDACIKTLGEHGIPKEKIYYDKFS
ncbi:MAG: 2Fe-2S iron-sulfur cluster binding domain-containing protein [Fibrobacteres bacterium]|nr:2Fe-2S iron-sulfur cluster binding domain-containing protein [Fibrobacterota bacterium]